MKTIDRGKLDKTVGRGKLGITVSSGKSGRIVDRDKLGRDRLDRGRGKLRRMVDKPDSIMANSAGSRQRKTW